MNISLHALALHPTHSVYYKADARMQDDENDGIILKYYENDPQNVKEITDISAPSTGACMKFFITFNDDVEKLDTMTSRIKTVFVTYAVPSGTFRKSSITEDPYMLITASIGSQCKQTFPSLKPEDSFVKVRSGHNWYNATSTFEFRPGASISFQKLD